MSATAGAMERLVQALGEGKQRGIPPVERWNPSFCGEIDMRIAADGTWYYCGSPIGRPALVKLFSSVLRRDGDDYVLVTPVEKLGIRVDDAPFQAVEMAIEGEGETRGIVFRTQVDDLVQVGPGNALRFGQAARGGLTPYVHVRRGLWARVTRALTYDLLALGEVRGEGEAATFGVAAGGEFFPAAPARLIEGL